MHKFNSSWTFNEAAKVCICSLNLNIKAPPINLQHIAKWYTKECHQRRRHTFQWGSNSGSLSISEWAANAGGCWWGPQWRTGRASTNSSWHWWWGPGTFKSKSWWSCTDSTWFPFCTNPRRLLVVEVSSDISARRLWEISPFYRTPILPTIQDMQFHPTAGTYDYARSEKKPNIFRPSAMNDSKAYQEGISLLEPLCNTQHNILHVYVFIQLGYISGILQFRKCPQE